MKFYSKVVFISNSAYTRGMNPFNFFLYLNNHSYMSLRLYKGIVVNQDWIFKALVRDVITGKEVPYANPCPSERIEKSNSNVVRTSNKSPVDIEIPVQNSEVITNKIENGAIVSFQKNFKVGNDGKAPILQFKVRNQFATAPSSIAEVNCAVNMNYPGMICNHIEYLKYKQQVSSI